MRLNIVKSKNAQQFYVIKSYRTENGKSTTKIVEKLGNYNDLSKVHADPIAWAKGYVEELNRKEAEMQNAVTIKCFPSEQIEKGRQNVYDGGYLFLQKIYYELRLDFICRKISEKYKFEYNLNEILSPSLTVVEAKKSHEAHKQRLCGTFGLF